MSLLIVFAYVCCILRLQCFQPSLELPELLRFINGTKITSPSQWPTRRKELKQLLDENILGTKPVKIPSILTWNKINSTEYNYALSSYFSFTLDISGSTPIIIEVICPQLNTTDTTKYPLIMTQYNHRGWAVYAVQRLFCSIRTPTADTRDDSTQFQLLYPNNTWGIIPRRAWLDSRIIDFIEDILSKQSTNPGINLDINNIGIFGHSRNGKQSLIAAAYDDRIGAVVGSSSGTPISAPFRLTARDFYGETCKSDKNRNWWTPQYQTWFGKENECPADGNFVIALIAPRYVMLANAINDNEGDISFANDKNYLINKNVFYNLLKSVPGSLTMQHRSGIHHGFLSVESYLDFFSFAFGKYNDISSNIINQFINPDILTNFTFNYWNTTYSQYINYKIPDINEPIKNKISWLLGSDVLGIGGGYNPGSSYCEEWSYIVDMFGQWKDNKKPVNYNVMNQSFSFGGYITGDIFYPQLTKTNASFPVIIYLTGYNYNLGITQTYSLHEESNTDPFYYHFATRGYIVVTYHQTGFGQRIYDGKYFYDRYGSSDQSKFGHMVRDVKLIIDFIECLTKNVRNNMELNPQCQTGESYTGPYVNTLNEIPFVDIKSLTIVGYSIGGSIGIHAAALDNRIINIASIAGFTPFRNNTNNLSNSGNHYLYEYHSLIPKLGLFANGSEHLIPYDYQDLFNLISPRNTLIYSPLMDRNANNNAVQQCINDIKSYWINNNAPNNLTIKTPNIVSNWCNTQYQVIEQWLQNTTTVTS